MRFYPFVFTGERRLKLTGESNRLDVNADFMTTGTLLNTPTLYPSAYLVLTSKGYTKHYYAGADRVAASLGGGGLSATGSNPEMQERANGLFWESHDRVNGRMLQETGQALPAWEYYGFIKDIPGRMNASVEFKLDDFHKNLEMLAEEQHDEKDVYFYHSDHLGSASWITDGSGIPVQHLQYLPFGEPFVDQHPAGYQERFRFTGKERDEETGYGYFSARYMDHELMTMWLSVDPMADKYPSISPYAYCAWNPVKLVDPDGNDWYEYTNKSGEKVIEWTWCHSQKQMKEKGIKGEYLGITASANGTYYGLLGDRVKENTEEGRAVKTTDQAIINRAKADSYLTTEKVDFGKVFQFKTGAFNSIIRPYKYAKSGMVQIMLNGNDNEGRLNDKMQVATPENPNELSGWYAGANSVKCPRLNIERGLYRKGPVAAISFHGAEKAEQRFNAMYSFLRKKTIVCHATKTSNGWDRSIY